MRAGGKRGKAAGVSGFRFGGFLFWLLVSVGCSAYKGAEGPNTGATGTLTNTINPVITAGASNVAPLTVGCGYANELCVAVTICSPGTQNCLTVNNVLLDTGSSGLRLFSSTIAALSLPTVTVNGSGQMAECISYLDGSSDWGSVVKADVRIGAQTASNVKVQSIDSAYQGIPSTCTNPDVSPASTKFNGIIGVGLFVSDCGPPCANSARNQTYYSCSGGSCTNVAVAEADQVSNPVALMPLNNNGVTVQLQNVGDGGATLSSGFLALGVATQTNNTPIGASVFTTDGNGYFTTVFQGQSYGQSFIDSGSNAIYFPEPSNVPICQNDNLAQGLLCPSSPLSFTATQIGKNGTSANVTFSIESAESLLIPNPSLKVFNDLAGPYSGGFDWGLPFFLGRTVYVGFENHSSALGSGTYWAW